MSTKSLRWLSGVFLFIGVSALAIGLYGLMKPEAEPVVIQRDETQCRAKFANFVIKHEELSKPERERWESFKAYMGPECVK